jgi:dTDP-4-dehydrorhamnose reductase
MRVLITGAKGQLGSDLLRVLSPHHEVTGFSHQELPVENIEAVLKKVFDVKPDLVVHAAAYTYVDDCEKNPEKAYLINALGTRNVVLASQKVRAKLLYISTDYIFDGEKKKPYFEFDPPNPLSVYGKSKLAGEWFVQNLLNEFYIVRTSWLYGLNGRNFVKTIFELAENKPFLEVVEDQVGSPTYTLDLAKKIAEIIESDYFGVYHITNQGYCSWFDFARKILKLSGVNKEVKPVKTEDFPRPAKRPKFSVLENFVLKNSGFSLLRNWEEALLDFLTELKKKKF